ncbi:MAG: histidine kinase [Novosphingobium sp.]
MSIGLREEAQSRNAITRSRRRATLMLIAAFWGFTFAVLSVRAVFLDPRPFAVVGPRRLITAAIGTMLCLEMVYGLARLRTRSFPERILWGLAGALAMSVILTMFSMTFNRVLMPVPRSAPFSLGEIVQWITIWLGYFLAWTGTHLALTYHWEVEDQQSHTSAMRELAQEARMAALRYQINPHFLFNTLNSISSLVLEQRNAEAETMLLHLSAFLRATLNADASGTIALSDEIAFQRLYLAIEEVRFPHRMCVKIDIPTDLSSSVVPALILQPLVENAIRYAVEPSERLTTITITADSDGESLRIVVEDDSTGIEAVTNGTGIGLNNVRERLHTHFGCHSRLTTNRTVMGGFRAEIQMPLAEVA